MRWSSAVPSIIRCDQFAKNRTCYGSRFENVDAVAAAAANSAAAAAAAGAVHLVVPVLAVLIVLCAVQFMFVVWLETLFGLRVLSSCSVCYITRIEKCSCLTNVCYET